MAVAFVPNPNNLPAHLFFITFLEILKAEKPDYVFLAFDGIGKTKRRSTVFDRIIKGCVCKGTDLGIIRPDMRLRINHDTMLL